MGGREKVDYSIRSHIQIAKEYEFHVEEEVTLTAGRKKVDN